MASSNVDQVAKAVGAGSVAFGVLAALSPSTLRRSYGDKTAGSGSLDYFGRTWGHRTAVLGALFMAASSEEERKRIATYSAAMNALDTLAALRANDLAAVTKVGAAFTSAAFSAAGAYVAANL